MQGGSGQGHGHPLTKGLPSSFKIMQWHHAEVTKLPAGAEGLAQKLVLDGVKVDYYGSMMSLQQVANVSVLDVHTISVQPWDKSMVGPVDKAIIAANLGLNPAVQGKFIRIVLPDLSTEEALSVAREVVPEHTRVPVCAQPPVPAEVHAPEATHTPPQFWKPALQEIPHPPAVHVAVPLVGTAQGVHEVVPQELGLVSETQAPEQLCVPVGHPQTPPAPQVPPVGEVQA